MKAVVASKMWKINSLEMLTCLWNLLFRAFSAVIYLLKILHSGSNFFAKISFRDMGQKFFGIEFVDILHIPMHRRLQTFAVSQWIFTFLFLGLLSLAGYFMLLFTSWYFIPLAYTAWYIYDYRTPERGGRRWRWIQNWRLWSYYRDYFPVSLHHTSALDPDKNYLFVYHPHGVFACGVFINFCTNATGFQECFPGIRPTVLSLKYQFLFPVAREYAMSLGVCPCSRRSIEWLMEKEGRGNAVVLVVGGASEALEARPGSLTLALEHRKGFIRIAMQHGTPLVPVFSFGENDLYYQAANPPGSRLRKFQTMMTKVLTFSPPAFYGRGMFNYTYGVLPLRHRIDVVVGAPMEVAQVDNPTEEQIDSIHKQYSERLVALFEAHKTKYGISAEQHLHII